MVNVDKWTAEKCGVELVLPYTGMKKPNFVYAGREYWHEWTMEDARCREIVREHFKICSDYFDGNWRSWSRTGVCTAISGEGDTIEVAEIKCLEAIMKSETPTCFGKRLGNEACNGICNYSNACYGEGES